MAARFSVEPGKMLATLKSTAFKGDVSNEQMIALLIVADQYGLNPWTKEIYAFPD
ncbi:recombinase RecT, partial [Escherichia coli]|uniref:recombinase RecT n=1 Tax=Escherichia coli TaxID=562 RepID=UPI003D04127A